MQRVKESAVSAHLLPTHDELKVLENRLGITFRNKKFLETALTHCSFLKEKRLSEREHYERIEFLGDKVLGLAVGQYLYRENPKAQEGSLTNFHSSLVNNEMLSRIARKIGLKDHIRVSKNLWREAARNEHILRYILACVFEAVVGAIFLDRGMGTVELFLREFLFPELEGIRRLGLHIDPKNRLQIISQAVFDAKPQYKLVSVDRPDCAANHEIEVYIKNKIFGKGKGTNRKEAEKAAAKDALQKEFGEFRTKE